MEVTVKSLQKKIHLNLPKIKIIAKSILKDFHIDEVELSILFVTSQKITALNKKFLGRAHTTDVLAFDLTDEEFSYKKKKVKSILGDIIISTDTVIKNSKKFRSSLKQEIVLYVIHGILHLLGYDDHSKEDIRKMRNKENQILLSLGRRIDNVIN